MRTIHHRPIALLLVIAMAALPACALNPKQKLYAAHQTLHSALVTADHTEQEICKVDPAAKNHCLAVPPVLSNAQHQAISERIVKLYDIDDALSTLVTNYKKGQPIPAQVGQMQVLVRELGELAKAIAPGPKTDSLVAKINDVTTMAAQIAAIFAGGDPGPSLGLPVLSPMSWPPARLEARFALPRPQFVTRA